METLQSATAVEGASDATGAVEMVITAAAMGAVRA